MSNQEKPYNKIFICICVAIVFVAGLILTPILHSTTTAEKWSDVMLYANPGSELAKTATERSQEYLNQIRAEHHAKAEKLAKTATTSEEWSDVMLYANPGSELAKTATERSQEYLNQIRAEQHAKAEELAREIKD